MNFKDKFKKIVKKNNSLVCVGLDPVKEKLPKHLLIKADPFFQFNKEIIDATHDLVCAYKPNSAFYEAEGIKGLKSLEKTCHYLKNKYPEIIIILDAKRADIDSTNLGYIKMAFNFLSVDAITLHPYLGKEAIQPFLDLKEKYFFILCKTSNKGSGEYQNLPVKSGTSRLNLELYKYVAQQVVKKWNKNGNCGLVVGATYPNELKEIRQIAKNLIFLIPGIGAQGGDLKKTIAADKSGQFLINSSRSIIYADSTKKFAEKARTKTRELKNLINKYC